MVPEQQPPPQASLLSRVFGSRIAQTIGIFGVAFTLFQGLDPFLEFSRFMTYLVDHWRELTREVWIWLASFFDLDMPPVLLDLLTVVSFIALFTIRSLRCRDRLLGTEQTFTISRYLIGRYKLITSSISHENFPALARVATIVCLASITLAYYLEDVIWINIIPLSFFVVAVMPVILLLMSISVIPLAIFLSLYVHIHVIGALVVAAIFGSLYGILAKRQTGNRIDAIVFNSERAIFVLIGILGLNYLGLYSHAILAFVEKATQ
jgi:hypothetical protein